jgi:hypothetical protein
MISRAAVMVYFDKARSVRQTWRDATMERMFRNFVFLVLLAFTLSAPLCFAQTGSITGTIKDASGAVLPGAAVTVTNIGTNAQRNTVTDERGDYNVTLLPVGVYRIQAEVQGFKTGLAENIMVNVNDKLRIDFTLQIGEVTERVVVTSAAPLVQSETSAVGDVVDNQKITELPLNGRQFESLSQLVPGALSPAPGSTLGNRGGFNVAGSRETSNSIQLDGIDNNDVSTNNFTLRPIVDAIQEFKVQTNSYSAEFGRGGGAVVTVTTKSGTNEFHGAAWEFIRNDVLDARDFFNSGDKIPFKRNQYGATLGGPIIRNKAFIFFAFEGNKRRQQFPSLQVVPSVPFRQGDFSALKTALKNPFVSGATFAGNQIPADMIHPVAKKVLALGSYPLPTPGLTGASNYLSILPLKEDAHQFNGRIDYRVSNANTLYGRYGYNWDAYHQASPGIAGGALNYLPGYPMDDIAIAQAFALVDTHVFSNNLVNELRTGFNRMMENREPLRMNKEDVGTEIGLPGTPRDPRAWGVPSISITGLSSIGDSAWIPRVGSAYQLTDSVSYNFGSHALRFGFEGRKLIFAATNGTNAILRFDGRWTGNAFADFLLGLPSQTSRDLKATDIRYYTINCYNAFFQDDFKVSNRLTLNMGLRYEFNSPIVEKYNRFGMFNIETQQYQVANENARTQYRPDKNNFGPRLGFALRPGASSASVIRGGYGIFYDLAAIGNNLEPAGKAPPFRIPEIYDASPTDPTALTLSNPFPFVEQGASAIYSAPSIDPGFRDAYVQQWNLGYQREFARNMVFEIAYIGSKGTRLVTSRDFNQAFPGTTGTVQSRRPYPQYGSINVIQSTANSTYHGLQSRLERRFSGGLSFLASYTFGHAIDDASGLGGGGASSLNQDSRNLKADRGNSDYDARHRFVISYIYELPYGHGKRFGKTIPAAVNAILGGWQLSGITSFQSGRPINIRLGSDNSRTGANRDRPNVTGIEPVIQDRTAKTVYLNKAAFATPPAGTFGNAPRGYFNGPGTNNFDFTLGKNFRTEKIGFQFRAELFNAFNHPYLNQPTATFTSPAFGTITSTWRDNRQVQFGLKITY